MLLYVHAYGFIFMVYCMFEMLCVVGNVWFEKWCHLFRVTTETIHHLFFIMIKLSQLQMIFFIHVFIFLGSWMTLLPLVFLLYHTGLSFSWMILSLLLALLINCGIYGRYIMVLFLIKYLLIKVWFVQLKMRPDIYIFMATTCIVLEATCSFMFGYILVVYFLLYFL